MEKFFAVAITGALAAWATGASAWDSTIPGASCVPENAKTQTGKLRFHNGAVKNAGGTGVAVICPIEVVGDPESVKATVNLKNYSNGTKSVNCAVREIAPSGAQLQSQSVAKNGIGAQSAASINKTLDVRNDNSSVIVRCSLPPQVGLVSVTASFDGDESSGGGETPTETVVNACLTSPDTNYGSRDMTVTMRNGTVLNNYNGHFYSSSTEYLIYRTKAGWFALEDYGERYGEERLKLEVKRGPSSCFEPESWKVTDKYGQDGALYIEFSSGEVAVTDLGNCKGVNVGHEVVPKQPSHVLSLNSGNYCEISPVD